MITDTPEINILKKNKDGNVSNRDIKKFLKEDSECLIIGIGKGKILSLSCWRVNSAQIAFYCIDCKVIHYHGWAKGHPNGHRCSHCTNQDSRFYSKGYYLICQGTLSEAQS